MEKTEQSEPTIRSIDFATVTSHQLRTPLTAIKWYLDLLLSKKVGTLNDQQQDFLSEIYRSNERMVRLVDDLTLVSEIENNEFTINPTDFDLCTVLESIIKEYKLFASAYSITLINNCSQSKAGSVQADPIFLRMALKNLLDNAIRYTLKGGSVVVDCKETDGELEVNITDTGVGIVAEEKDKVFSKFFRSASVVEMQTEGTGLGLYIVKAFIEAHKGKIWFDSEIGKGTTFRFTLPAADKSQQSKNTE